MNALLEAREVSFAYPQDGRGLHPLSFDAGAGEAVWINGPSGCGKSTLARCLSGLIPHLYRGQYGGQVCVNGAVTAQTPLWQLTEQVGMVFQNPASQILAPTVEDEIIFGLENLGLPRAEIRRRLDEALERFGLAEMRDRSPQTLSGGEQQKLALAAATARRPPVLVLDEPLSMLDVTAALEFVAHTQALRAEGAAVVYCEHRQEYLDGIPGLRTLSIGEQRTAAGPGAGGPVSTWPLPWREPFHLQIRGLGVARGGRVILDSLDLDLPGGKIVALVGRNGVGKTTLLRSVAGLQKHAGMIRVKEGEKEEPPRLGMVFQNPDLQLFNASVREEICYHLDRQEGALYEWVVDALGLKWYEETPPLLLSEGEKRRLALAMILVRAPEHGLLLDEPSLGQDEGHKEILLRILRAYANAGHLVVYATHDLELAARADRLVLLGAEGIAAQGEAAEVMQMEGAWQKLGFVLPAWLRVKWPG